MLFRGGRKMSNKSKAHTLKAVNLKPCNSDDNNFSAESKDDDALGRKFHSENPQPNEPNTAVSQIENVFIKDEKVDYEEIDPVTEFPDLEIPHDPDKIVFKEEIADNDINPYEDSNTFADVTLNQYNYSTRKKVNTTDDLFIYGCDLCDYKCRYPSAIKRHRLCHTGEMPFSCDQCSFVCSQSGNLKRHKYLHSDRKVFSCDVCSFTCIQFEYLKTHKLTHLPEKPIKCEECDYRCVSSKLLKAHMMKHTNERPFGCEHCSFTSRSLANLKIHRRIHTGEKPYKCNICSFSCRQNGHLESHKMTHSKTKPFACPLCSFVSKSSNSLKYHKFTHTGEKPFSCNHCSYTCRLAHQLKLHIKRIHKIELADRRTQAFRMMANSKCSV